MNKTHIAPTLLASLFALACITGSQAQDATPESKDTFQQPVPSPKKPKRSSNAANPALPPEPPIPAVPPLPVLPRFEANAFGGGGDDNMDHVMRFEMGDMDAFGRSHSAPVTLVIKEGADAKWRADMSEDLAVMSRLLTKKVERVGGRDHKDMAMGIMISTMGGRQPQAIYVEGMGAMLMLNVRFPLVAPPAVDDTKADRETNSAWEDAKNEVYGNRPVGARMIAGGKGESAQQYDEDKVSELKNELISALANATNIRNLKSDESVVVVVTGGSSGGAAGRTVRGKKGTATIEQQSVTYRGGGGNAPGNSGSTLVLKVKKSDLDSAAAKKQSPDELAKKVRVIAY